MLAAAAAACALWTSAPADAEPQPVAPPAAADGSVQLPAGRIPYSTLASDDALHSFVELTSRPHGPPPRDVAASRAAFAARLEPQLANLRRRYPVAIRPEVIGGVQTDVVTPLAGEARPERVLINLHGGGFVVGGRIGGQVEATPIAALGRIKVVAVDYRMGPEHRFPAASEDVAAVYRALLKRYRPENIGIYGCSSGGILTAQSVAWFQTHGLPRPGAIGIFCAGAIGSAEGDSLFTANLLTGSPLPAGPVRTGEFTPYLIGADIDDPQVSPVKDPKVLGRFPPTLFITGTRDAAMSDAVFTHSQMVKLGVRAELHVWEAMTHAFYTTDAATPETLEARDVIVRFFDRTLGRAGGRP